MDGTETAFPVIGSHKFYEEQGLSKRELFAAMAMQGMVSSGYDSGDVRSVKDWRCHLAHDAVRYADALIEALNK